MKIAAIISEYNPLHNGHVYHINKTREFGCSHIIAIMSGNFVQRGDFAIISKTERTKMALMSGVDVVIELPTIWATSSAEIFSNASIKIIDALQCVNYLSFGIECDNFKALEKLSEILLNDPIESKIFSELKMGVNLPTARENAIRQFYGNKFSSIISKPNNILALEYLKSLKKINSNIIPIPIKRIGSDHDCKTLKKNMPSAAYVRELIYSNRDYSNLLPKHSAQIIKTNISNLSAPTNMQNIQTAILAKLRTMNKQDLSDIADVSEGLENRIYNAVKNATSLENLYSLIKTKRYTHSRIRRIILHAFLNITKNDLKREIPYIRILGFNKNSKDLLGHITKNSKIPVVTKKSNVDKLDDNSKYVFNLENTATDLYNLSTPRVQKCGLESSQKIVII